MGFIPIDQMKQLREAARQGDQRAIRILKAQMDGKDYSGLLGEYFNKPSTPNKPAPTQTVSSQPAMGNPAQSNGIPMPEQANFDPYKDIKDPKLRKFLEYNDVKPGDAEYETTVEAYYKEFPKARPMAESKPSEEDEDEFGIPDTSDIHLPDDIDDDSGSIYGAEDEDDGDSIYGDEDEPINDDEPYVEQTATSNPNAPVQKEKNCLDALIADEIEAIEGYNKAIMEITGMDLSEAVKKGLLADLEEIRKDEFDHLDKLKRMKESMEKKEEKEVPGNVQ